MNYASDTIVQTRRSNLNLRSAFTLNELLIVIAIAVLVMALAVPAFNAITNSRSVDAAENQIASFLGGTRSEAVGLQEPRGVLFFTDPSTNRVTLVQVSYSSVSPRPAIELLVGREEMVLPSGVGLQGVPSGVGVNFPWPTYALIMFDDDGKLMMENVSFSATTKLGQRLVGTQPASMAATALPNIGFALYDSIAYQQIATTGQKAWLDDNATPFLINRYNGSLLRGQ